MVKILFINACVRPASRTLELAKAVLQNMQGSVEQIDLYQTPIKALDLGAMEKRDKAAQKQDFSDPCFDLAKQFADADSLVIAAPYWDLMFPAVLKDYLENIAVCGITFRYSDKGIPEGLCKAKEVHYVTTAGGFIGPRDFGFLYIKELSQTLLGIPDVYRYTAEGLDIMGADVNAILQKAKDDINKAVADR